MRFTKSLLETLNSKNKIFKIMLLANITHTLSLLHDKHSPGSTADRCTTASSCTGDFAIRQALAPCLFLSSASLLSSSVVSTAPFLLIMNIINRLEIKIPYCCCLNLSRYEITLYLLKYPTERKGRIHDNRDNSNCSYSLTNK